MKPLEQELIPKAASSDEVEELLIVGKTVGNLRVKTRGI